MRISWADIGFADQPGVHTLENGLSGPGIPRPRVKVSAAQIVQWKEHPDGRFDCFPFAGNSQSAPELILTTFWPDMALTEAA